MRFWKWPCLPEHGRRTLLRFFLIHAFNALCLMGFLYQVEMISYSFFKYETVTRIDNKVREEVEAPNLALCFRYIDIMDFKRLRKETNIVMKPAKELDDISENQSKLTVQQILEYSPPSDKCMNWCLYRYDDSVRTDSLNSHEECAVHWNVDKFYTQEFVCYRFSKKVNDNYILEVVAHSLQFSHTLFGIGLIKEFNAAGALLAIVYYGTFPFVSRDYTSLTTRVKGVGPINKYYLTFFRTNFFKQPAPYDSMCVPGIKFEDKYKCMRDCLNKNLTNIGRVPFSEILDKNWPYKHINVGDLKNETIFELVNDSNKKCLDKCEFITCAGDFTSTYLTGSSDTTLKTTSYLVRIPQAPLVIMRSHPKLVLQDFFVYLCSCFGIWFGISLYHFNPFPKLFHYLEIRKTKKKEEVLFMTRRRHYRERHPNLFEYPLKYNPYLRRIKY